MLAERGISFKTVSNNPFYHYRVFYIQNSMASLKKKKILIEEVFTLYTYEYAMK